MYEDENTKVDKKDLLKVFKKKLCNVSATCEAANISRQTFYEYMKKDKKFERAIEDAKEGLIDFAESKLMEGINNGDSGLIQFFLRTKGRSRGYDPATTLKLKGAIANVQAITPEEIMNVKKMIDGEE